MVCKLCAEAADTNKLELHKICEESSLSSHCTCQHRVNAIVIKSGAHPKDRG
jgi:hypothetical protein